MAWAILYRATVEAPAIAPRKPSGSDQPLERKKLPVWAKIPAFAPGDTVIVNVNSRQGTRNWSRAEAYEGVVIAKRNRGHEQQLHRAQGVQPAKASSAPSSSTAR